MATTYYTPYPVPTPWINKPSAYGYPQSQAIKSSGSPQGFVVNPYAGPKYASPADVNAVTNKASQPFQSQIVTTQPKQPEQNNNQNNGGNTVTSDRALKEGWDINNLPSGYVRAQEGPSAEDRAREEAKLEEQRGRVRAGINKQADSYISYLDGEINTLPTEEEEGAKQIEGNYQTSVDAVDRERKRNTREVGEQIVQLMRSGNDRFGSVGAGNSSATAVMLPYALGRESAKANSKIGEVALTQTKAIESEKNQMLYDLRQSVKDVKRRFSELRAGADERRQQALITLEENTLAGMEQDARQQLSELRSRTTTLKDWVTQRTAQLNDYKMQGYKVDPLTQVQEEVSTDDFINPMVFAGIKKRQDSAYA